jgi:hypothetical protein
MFHPGIMMTIDQIVWRGQKPPTRWEDKPCTNNPSYPQFTREKKREREFPECSFKTRSLGGFWFPGNVHLMVFGSQTG